MPRQYDLLSLGVLLVIVALVLVAFAVQIIIRLDEALALIIAFYGTWTIVFAGIRTQKPEKYGRGAYSTFVMGLLLTAFGGAWFLAIEGAPIILSIALLLLIIGILALASAIPSMRRKQY